KSFPAGSSQEAAAPVRGSRGTLVRFPFLWWYSQFTHRGSLVNSSGMASGWTRVNIIVALKSIRGGNLELGTKVRNSSFWCVSDGPPPDRFQPPAATRDVCDMVRQQRLNHRRLPYLSAGRSPSVTTS